jgi:Tfp pilus assembly protein PilF
MLKIFNFIIKTSVCLLVFLLPLFFLPFSFEAFEFNKQYLLFFLVSLASFFWLAKMVFLEKEIRFKRTPLDIPILVFFLIAVVGTFFSADKVSSLFGFYGKFSDGLIGLISLILMYFLITNNVKPQMATDKKSAKISQKPVLISVNGLIKTFIWSIFFVLLFSYFSLFGIWGNFKGLPSIMLRTTFNPITGSLEGLAIFLAVVVIFLTGLIMTEPKSENSKFKKFIVRTFLLLSLILLIIIDFNRAWVLLLTALLICVGIALGKRILKDNVNKLLLPLLLIILSTTLLFINVSGLQSLIFKTQLPKEQVLNQRYSLIVAYRTATENIRSGLVGSGIGTFYYDFARFKPKDFNQSALWQIRFDRPGNYLAEILGTMGFLSILSYLFLATIFLMISYLFLHQSRENLPLIMAFLALLIGQFVYYQNTTLSFYFWLFMALSAAVWQKPLKEKVISFKNFPELALIFSVLLMVLGVGLLIMYSFAARFYLADVNYQRSYGEEGTKRLEKSVELNPYQPAYKIILARDYFGKIISEEQKPNSQRDQTKLSEYIHKAITYIKGGDLNGKHIKGAIELAPNQVASWEVIGMIYREIGGLVGNALDWAIKSFEKAISLEPNNPVLHTEIGKLYLASNKADKAREEFSLAKDIKPDYVDALIQMVLTYEKENNLNEAIKQMEGLANSEPLNPEVLFQLGRLYFNNNQIAQAISQFETVINLAPDYSNAHYSLGVAYQRMGEKSKAIVEFEKVLSLNPGSQDIQEKLKQLKQPAEIKTPEKKK